MDMSMIIGIITVSLHCPGILWACGLAVERKYMWEIIHIRANSRDVFCKREYNHENTQALNWGVTLQFCGLIKCLGVLKYPRLRNFKIKWALAVAWYIIYKVTTAKNHIFSQFV